MNKDKTAKEQVHWWPWGGLETRCGIFMPQFYPRVTMDFNLVTCPKCLAMQAGKSVVKKAK